MFKFNNEITPVQGMTCATPLRVVRSRVNGELLFRMTQDFMNKVGFKEREKVALLISECGKGLKIVKSSKGFRLSFGTASCKFSVKEDVSESVNIQRGHAVDVTDDAVTFGEGFCIISLENAIIKPTRINKE